MKEDSHLLFANGKDVHPAMARRMEFHFNALLDHLMQRKEQLRYDYSFTGNLTLQYFPVIFSRNYTV